MSRRKEKKRRLEIERLESRDTPSATAFPFAVGIIRAEAAMPPQAQAVDHSAVCLDAVVVTPEAGPSRVTCPEGGFVPEGQETARIATNHNETLVRDRT